MDVEVNGEDREFADGTTLAGLLEQLGTAQRGVAVAVDGTVVTRSEWQDVVLADGAKVEILIAVQGG
ncbi:MAG: sulfur carrier protein ThiS [Actinophytocola sp.]|nr:sulfur carrier protein ThiS [Actinophytocola sp.]